MQSAAVFAISMIAGGNHTLIYKTLPYGLDGCNPCAKFQVTSADYGASALFHQTDIEFHRFAYGFQPDALVIAVDGGSFRRA